MVDKDLFLYGLAVVAIMKNEGAYLKEWLDYHLAAGVDHFYLYDNESPDNQSEVAKPYIEAGLVTYTPFPGKNMQYPAYNDAVKRFKFQSRYMAFIDGDEFIYPKMNIGGGVLLKSSTKFYQTFQTQAAWQLIGNVSAPTDRRKPIILAACWRGLLGVRPKIG